MDEPRQDGRSSERVDDAGGDPPDAPEAAAEPRSTESMARRSRRRPGSNPGVAAFDLRGVRSALVGRDAELTRITELCARTAEQGTPQVITVIGNQGTGKSRLVTELASELGRLATPVRVVRGHADSDGGRYSAISSLLRDRFDLLDGDDSDRARSHFEAEVERVFGDERASEVLHVLGRFIDLHFPDSPFLRVLRDSPQRYDEIACTVLSRFLVADAQKGPLALVLDDMQWADEPTLRLLHQLAASLGQAPVAMLLCARPDMLVRAPEWAAAAHARIDLRSLDPDDAETMFRNLLARCDQIPDDVVDDAVEMTGGNPHFLTQLVRLFLANGTIDASGDVWHLDADRAADTELPISIEEAIEARIAALGTEERELLERGAVFGNVFWVSALVALTRIDSTDPSRARALAQEAPDSDLAYTWEATGDPLRQRITALLDDLVDRDYLLQLGAEDSTIPGEMELVFKHNLERELIVNSTEPDRLARYHRLAAHWLETKLAGRSEEQLEFLAQLYERGGDLHRASHCYLAGGDKARARYANQEAVDLYTRGLAMLDGDDALARMAALHNLGDVLDLVGDSDGALDRFRAMLRLAWLFDDPARAGAAQGRIGRIYRRRGEYDQAMQHLREAHTLFTRAGDERGIAATLDDMGQIHWLRGAYSQALDLHRQALSLRRGLGDQRSIALSLANIGRVHRDSGGFKAAISQLREALDLRRNIGDMSGVVESLCDLGGVHTEDGNYDMALELFSEAYGIAMDIGDKLAQARVLSRLGECKSASGRGAEAVDNLDAAIDLATSLGDRVLLSECCRRLAEVSLSMGEVTTAYDHAQRSLHISEAVGSRVHIGNAHRVLAEVLSAGNLAPEERAQAEDHFKRAIEILAGMKNDLELARVYRAFAGYCERTGAPEDAAKLRRRADEIYGRLRGAAAV